MHYPEAQHPPAGPFSKDDLSWEPHDRRGGAVLEAVIPSDRLDDFLAGEHSRGACAFTKCSTHKAAKGAHADSLGKKQQYHCSHGPEDHSQPRGLVGDPSQKPSSGTGSRPNTKRATGASQKRGCKCRFTAAPLLAKSGLTLLRYGLDDHINHGPACPEGAAGWASLPGHVSTDIKEWVRTRLLLDPDFNPAELLRQLREHVLAQAGLSPTMALNDAVRQLSTTNPQAARNLLTNSADVRCANRCCCPLLLPISPAADALTSCMPSYRNVRAKLDEKLWKLHVEEGECVRLFATAHPDDVFAYSDDPERFYVGIQTDWQRMMMVQHGNGSIIAMDATFGVNELKVRRV